VEIFVFAICLLLFSMQLRIPGSTAGGGASEGSSAQADRKGLDMVAVTCQNTSQSDGLMVVMFCLRGLQEARERKR
jgi:hypothetical protein